VENNVKSSSVETSIDICTALGVEAGGIMNQLQNKEHLFLIRQDEGENVDISHAGFAIRRFCPSFYRLVIDSAMFSIEPGKNSHEILCVLKGSLELVQGAQTVRVGSDNAGLFFADPQRQRLTNLGGELPVAIWAGTL
jgi:hypothetical protein